MDDQETSEQLDKNALADFTKSMGAKLSKSREKGKYGWNDENVCSIEFLTKSLVEHLAKGDMVDVANFAMFIHQRAGQKSIPVSTCTPNERAFLDEIREKGEFSDRNNEYTGIAIGEYTFINQVDFTRSNLSELVERKG